MVTIKGNQNDGLAMFAFYGEIINPHLVYSTLDGMMKEGHEKKVHRAISMYLEHHDGIGHVGSVFKPEHADDNSAVLTAGYNKLFRGGMRPPPALAFARFNAEAGYGDDDPQTVDEDWSSTGSRHADTIVELWIRYREKGRITFGLRVESAHEESPLSTVFRIGTDGIDSSIVGLDEDIMKPLKDESLWTEWEG